MSDQANYTPRRCPTCAYPDVPDAHIGRCEQTTRARKEATKLGAGYNVPEVTTDDLWAHMGHIASPEDATRIVRQVLDLGWRPVVGSDKKRLWSS